jgi:hypothetical protein
MAASPHEDETTGHGGGDTAAVIVETTHGDGTAVIVRSALDLTVSTYCRGHGCFTT